MKPNKIILAIALLAIIALVVYKGDGAVSLGGSEARINQMGDLISFATSTGSFGTGEVPVKLLDLDASRRYAIFTNVSDTTVYLFATTTDLGINGSTDKNATSTQMATELSGIPVIANGSYEVLPENLIYGHWWATSTAGVTKKAINISYK